MDRWGIDIRDLGEPHLTLRRLGVFIRHLPRESATRQLWQGPSMRWGDAEHLLAMLVDGLAELNFMFASVYSAKGSPKPKRPLPVKRPTDTDTTPNGAETSSGRVNLEGRQTIVAGSLSIAELDQVIEAQTGVAHGIAKEG